MSNDIRVSTSFARTSHMLRIVDEGESIVTYKNGPSHNDFMEASRKTRKIFDLIYSLSERFFQNDIKNMARYIGFEEENIEYIESFMESFSKNVIYRSDLIQTSHGWKLLELNVGSTVGGLFYASMPRLSGIPQKYDVLKNWAKKTIDSYKINGPVAFVEHSKNLKYMKPSLTVMANELSLAMGGGLVKIVGAGELKLKGGKLKSGKDEIKYIINLFNELDVKEKPSDYIAINRAIKDNIVKIVMGPRYRFFANKGVLALLYELKKQNKLTNSESKIVSTFVSPTFWVTKENISHLIQNQNELILKPIDGYAGMGIKIGCEVSRKEWEDTLLDIVENKNLKSFVVQEFFPPSTSEVTLTSKDGKSIIMEYQLLWGVFNFNRSYLGAFLRAKKKGGSSIINHANGASTGPITDYYCSNHIKSDFNNL